MKAAPQTAGRLAEIGWAISRLPVNSTSPLIVVVVAPRTSDGASER